MIHLRIVLCCAAFLTVFAAPGQESLGQQREEARGQASSGTEAQKAVQQMPRRGGDIVADNLDHVAATANQILEILNQDAGLMVELKRMLAEDAGESGQILEESDLSESAVTQRIVEDLRIRMVANGLS